MITSNFTLEYNFDATEKWSPNIRRNSMPSQLARLGVSEPAWSRIYDSAEKVVEQAAAREKRKQKLDLRLRREPNGPSLPLMRKVAIDKEVLDGYTLKGWLNLCDECADELGPHGVSASLMTDAKRGATFGIDFRCDARKIMPNKLKLEFVRRTGTWTWPRDEVPAELAALHVSEATWASVWDGVYKAHEMAGMMEAKIDNKMKLMPLKYEGLRKLMAEVDWFRRDVDREWGRLLEFVEDELFMWGVSASLVFAPKDDETKYSGVILRFKPIIPFVATVAVPLPSAPNS